MNSGNVKLRTPEPDDVELLYEWENNTNIWHLGNTRVPFSKFDLEQYVMNSSRDIYINKQVRFMIDISNDNHNNTIGCIDLFDFDPANQRACIGILISEEYQKHGYASQALDILIDYAFNQLHLHQLYCGVTENNPSSLKLFENKNFNIIGIKKDWVLHQKRWINELSLQLINKDSTNV